jgi:hypothetical protein
MGEGGGKEYVKLLYVLSEYRIHNTETHVHKITDVPVFIWRLYLRILMRVQMALASLVAISGPKQSLCNGCCPHRNHYVPHHINNRFINSYNTGHFLFRRPFNHLNIFCFTNKPKTANVNVRNNPIFAVC